MKRKPLSQSEHIQFLFLRWNLSHKLLQAGFAPDDAAAAALCNNEALQTILRARKQAGSAKGAKETVKTFDRPDLDDLIRGCLLRGESTREYVRAWADEFDLSRSTIYRKIEKLKTTK